MYNIHIVAFIILLLVLLVAISVMRNDKDIEDLEGKTKEEENIKKA
jgi:hypothetical protein